MTRFFSMLVLFAPSVALAADRPRWRVPDNAVASMQTLARSWEVFSANSYDADEPKKKKVPDAVFVPTPKDVVGKMLELASVKKEDVLYDLGSGDGRIVIAAAKKHGCKAIGVELDKELVEKSRERARVAGVEIVVEFQCMDLFESDFNSATVVALYILPEMSRKLIPKFDKLQPGSRIVCHEFAIPGVKPDKVMKVTSSDDDVERPLYLYTIPLKKEKP
jgi:protein-L-isoaspartate O-methyltransferase